MSKIEILKNLKTLEILALVIGWFYLLVSGIVVIVGSIVYVLLMLNYWQVRNEPFPGVWVLLCATAISMAIMIIWISIDMIHGIKKRNHEYVCKFRIFALTCLILSFILIPMSIFEVFSMKTWESKGSNLKIKIPDIDKLMLILVNHMIIFIIIDGVYDDYKHNKPSKLEQKEDLVKNLSDSPENEMLHIVEIS